MAQETLTAALFEWKKRGGMGREMEGRFKREEIYVYLWVIHIEVWQKTAKFCKAIILQQKINKLKKKKSLLRNISIFLNDLLKGIWELVCCLLVSRSCFSYFLDILKNKCLSKLSNYPFLAFSSPALDSSPFCSKFSYNFF